MKKSFNFSLELFYKHVYPGKSFCQPNGTGDWTTEELKGMRNDLDWYIDRGNGVCNIGNNGSYGDVTCAKICQDIDGCRYFSVSKIQECYACFIHKTCNDPYDDDLKYKIYEKTMQKGNYCKKNREI